jgi:hypothetical protein
MRASICLSDLLLPVKAMSRPQLSPLRVLETLLQKPRGNV